MHERAAKMGFDRNVWFGHVEVATSKAVGREPARYVEHIEQYCVACKFAHETTDGKVLFAGNRPTA
jgi:hypothetical protein